MTRRAHLGTTLPDGGVVPWCDLTNTSDDEVLPPDTAPCIIVYGNTCPRCVQFKARTLGLPTRTARQHIGKRTTTGDLTPWCGRPVETDDEVIDPHDPPMRRRNSCPHCVSARRFELDIPRRFGQL